MESLSRNKKQFKVIYPLYDEQESDLREPIFEAVYESALAVASSNILSVNFKSVLSRFSRHISDIENPSWRARLRDIYRYFSCLHDALYSLSNGAIQTIDALSGFNILKSAKALASINFPSEDLERISGSSKLHNNHIEFQKIIKTTASTLNKDFDNSDYPLFFLWLYLIFQLKAKEYAENNHLNDASIFLVRMIEVLSQAVLLSDGHISHKGYGRFCIRYGDGKNLMGAGSYLLLLERYSYINSGEARLLDKIIKSRNQLLTAHGFTSLSDNDFHKYHNALSVIAKRIIKNSIKKEVYEGFNRVIGELNNARIVGHFCKKNIQEITVEAK